MTRIALVYFDAGSGHRSAALSLQEVIRHEDASWCVDLVNLQELLDPIDFVRRVTGVRIQDAYNSLLRNGWTLGNSQLIGMLHWWIRMLHDRSVGLLEAHWRERRPDLVASLVPHFNRALCESFARVCPARPFVTILTDIADHPPHFWIEKQEQFVICGSERAVEQAERMGLRNGRVFRTSGMILNPRFYRYDRVDREQERQRRGLDAERMTGLVLFGGEGSTKMIEIGRRLDESGLPVQLIFICGKNEALARALRSRQARFPRVVEGFTTEIPYFMQLSDFFVGKPGPGSVAEALAMGLPVIVDRNAWTLPQERYNTDWIVEQQVGLVVRNFAGIAKAVAELLEPRNFSLFRKNAAAMQNRALFEVPRILRTIVDGRTGPT